MTAEDVWALEVTVGDQQVLIGELRAALRRSEALLTALAMGMAENVTVDQVCDEGHLTSLLKDVRASLGIGK